MDRAGTGKYYYQINERDFQMNSIYTDLAMELRELNPDIEGVSEEDETSGEIRIKRIGILTETAARKIGKAIGSYVSLSADALEQRPLDLFESVTEKLAEEIRRMLKSGSDSASILVVGLGNRSVTPDSLGPRTAEKIFVTRHIKQYMPEAFDFPVLSVASVAPGVLGATGVETSDIVRGIVERVKPDLIIAVDSLSSRRAARISTTIQLSNAGISPGSGVGNTRADMSEAKLGVPVIAVGVPLVVHASTIMLDTIGMMANETGKHGDEEQLKELAKSVAEKQLDDMIVTPKDIDTIVGDMSTIIANALNMAFFGDKLPEVRSLLA